MGALRKADLHLHTRHSGWQRIPLIDALDCYLDPVEVVQTALDRGMDYVALTDHDSIGGWLELYARRPDLRRRVIPGVEVEAEFPDWGLKVHINFLGVSEAQHLAMQPLRKDIYKLLRYARAQGLLAVFNHPLRTLWRHPQPARFIGEVFPLYDGYEALNSASPEIGNRAAAVLARLTAQPGILVGGSDAHTLARVASAYTLAEGETPEEFLQNVRRGACAAGGMASGLLPIIADVYRVVGQYYASLLGATFNGAPARRLSNFLWSLVLLPGAVLMPALMPALNDAQYRLVARWTLRCVRALESEARTIPRLRAGLADVVSSGTLIESNPIAWRDPP